MHGRRNFPKGGESISVDDVMALMVAHQMVMSCDVGDSIGNL